MKYEVVYQHVDFSGEKPVLQCEAIASFESVGRASDYADYCNNHEKGIFFVREK